MSQIPESVAENSNWAVWRTAFWHVRAQALNTPAAMRVDSAELWRRRLSCRRNIATANETGRSTRS